MAVAAGHRIDLVGWRAEFDDLMGLIVGRFVRVESRRLARDALLGLLSPVAVKNCWTLAEPTECRPTAVGSQSLRR